jgi:hypothetical protein
MLKFGGGEASPPLEAIEYILLETGFVGSTSGADNVWVVCYSRKLRVTKYLGIINWISCAVMGYGKGLAKVAYYFTHAMIINLSQ